MEKSTVEKAKWLAITTVEPRLLAIEQEIKQFNRTRGFCANDVWYGYNGFSSLRNRMQQLVGWDAEKEELRSPVTYEFVYDYLYSSLPDCRHGSEA